MAEVRCFAIQGASIVEVPTDAGSLNELSLRLPHGVYTTFRTYANQMVLRLDAHLDRLVESASIEGQSLGLDKNAVREAVAAALVESGFALARVRITVGFAPSVSIFVSLDELHELPPAAYEQGVSAQIAERSLRREAPRSKSTRFIGPAASARDATTGANEVLLVDEQQNILEGSSSNFFAVLDRVLRTADAGVLAGVTRGIVLGSAQELLPVELSPVQLADVPRLQEAFITSVSRAVLPVVDIDSYPVGDGRPGPITRELMRRFEAALQQELEPIVPRPLAPR